MPRLPPAPDLDWKPDGTPVARGFGDVYFSTANGLEETRAVFLAGCGLPERWAGRDSFTVAETGFGTGLNFLALWDLWNQARKAPDAWLHYVSFEAFPMHRRDAARALSVWPELATLADALLHQWPHGARGVRRLCWPDDQLTLTLHIDDIANALPGATFEADAWFLDGFSPSRNAAMWAAQVFALMAERSAPGARAATFTVARAVRDGLGEAGFEVSKQPGFGRKRDRLEAVFRGTRAPKADRLGLRPATQAPKRLAIIGGGIAGACLAMEAKAHGLDPVLFDERRPASGASGNPLALVMPRLDAADTVQARLLIDAYLHARCFYLGQDGVEHVEVRQDPRGEDDIARFAKVLADPPLPLDDLEALATGGMLHKGALILRPQKLIRGLLREVNSVIEARVSVDLAMCTVNGEAYDAIVLACGWGVAKFASWLGLVGKLGQVEHVDSAPHTPASAIASGHYALASGPDRLWGATFEAAKDEIAGTSDAARASNAKALASLSPWWLGQICDAAPTSRSGIRATTNDRLPCVGRLPDVDVAKSVLVPLKSGREVDVDAPAVPGLYLMAGLGSRGFTFAPWMASLLISQLLDIPRPATQAGQEAVSPMRLVRRALKRGQPLGDR
ncbi:MAG: tRNA (5-methylaminomethyl-2-thiouridine)(34)-methyltransferase MnmD [Pseudomonadota bacterium]